MAGGLQTQDHRIIDESPGRRRAVYADGWRRSDGSSSYVKLTLSAGIGERASSLSIRLTPELARELAAQLEDSARFAEGD